MRYASSNGLACVFLVAFSALAGADESGYGQIYGFEQDRDGQSPGGLTADRQGNLYGTSQIGPPGDCCGTVFKLAPDGTKTVLYAFKGGPSDGLNPNSIAIGPHGALYGTAMGGTGGYGVVFRISKTGREKVLVNFNASTGVYPYGGLIRGHDGNFYGTLAQGGGGTGTMGGTVYKLTPDGVFSVIYIFRDPHRGCHPWGGVVQDKAGMLYGISNTCGDTGQGVIYKVDPATGIESVLHTLSGVEEGADPVSRLTIDDKGNLYGGTVRGGAATEACQLAGCGLIFKMGADGKYEVLYRFQNAADGIGSSGPLVRDGKGTIFGTTRFGGDRLCNCGTIFRFEPRTGIKTTLHVFHGAAAQDGAFPDGLVKNRRRTERGGLLYGTTLTGGACMDEHGFGCGTIYKVSKY